MTPTAPVIRHSAFFTSKARRHGRREVIDRTTAVRGLLLWGGKAVRRSDGLEQSALWNVRRGTHVQDARLRKRRSCAPMPDTRSSSAQTIARQRKPDKQGSCTSEKISPPPWSQSMPLPQLPCHLQGQIWQLMLRSTQRRYRLEPGYGPCKPKPPRSRPKLSTVLSRLKKSLKVSIALRPATGQVTRQANHTWRTCTRVGSACSKSCAHETLRTSAKWIPHPLQADNVSAACPLRGLQDSAMTSWHVNCYGLRLTKLPGSSCLRL